MVSFRVMTGYSSRMGKLVRVDWMRLTPVTHWEEKPTKATRTFSFCPLNWMMVPGNRVMKSPCLISVPIRLMDTLMEPSTQRAKMQAFSRHGCL